MDISASTAHGGVVKLSSVEQAQQTVVAQKTDQFASQGLSVGEDAPNVSTSPAYSPAIYAQAAQFQLYTQSGALASLSAQQGVAPSLDAPFHENPDEIAAVEGPGRSTVDTHA